MFYKIIRYINNLLTSVDTFNKHINQYKTISKEPALPSYAYINWGMFLITHGNKEKGLEKLNQSILMNKSNPEVYMNIGVTYAQVGKFDEALKNFRKAVRLDNNNARAWGYLAGVYSELNENSAAKSAFERSLKLDRANPHTYLNYGIYCVKNNQKDLAKNLFKKAYILDPVNLQPLMMWGLILVEENEFKSAFYKFEKIVQSQPLNVDALYLCGLCSLKMGKYQDCIEYCKKSSSILVEKKENYLLLTEAYLSLEDKDNCLSSFEKYEQYCLDDWKYYNSWGIALQHWGDYEASIDKFRKSIELKPDEFIGHNSLSCSLIKLDRLDEAKHEIDEVLKLEPGYASCYYNLGQIYMRQELYQNAIDVYKKAVSLDANLKKVYFNIGGAYHYLNDIKNAMKYWQKAIDYDKQNINAYINLAMTSVNDLDDSTKALRYIRSAYEINKYEPNVVFNYGLILMKSNDLYRAQEKFEEAYKLDCDLIITQIALAECKVKLNKPKEAIEILDKIKDKKQEDKDYLLTRVIALKEILKQEDENQAIIDEINQICDKIQEVYGDSALVEEIKQQN